MTGDDIGTLRRILQHVEVLDRARLADELHAGRTRSLGPESEALVRFFLREPPGADPLPESGLADCLQGWRAYYGADYELAGTCFARAWARDDSWASWAALGLCKVCSDLGHWERARGWGLAALRGARDENDFERVCEASGALGEVFLRAGHPKLAYELVSLDAAMLPPGSGHRDRLGNYLAVCLGRLGHAALAAPMLWHGFFAAREDDPLSAAHSRASLFVLSLLSRDQALFSRLESALPPPPGTEDSMPESFVDCVRAFWASGDSTRLPTPAAAADAVAHLDRAQRGFATSYPVEFAWVEELRSRITGAPHDPGRLAGLRARAAPAPTDSPPSILDAKFVDADLSSPYPFPLLGRGEPWEALRMFFV